MLYDVTDAQGMKFAVYQSLRISTSVAFRDGTEYTSVNVLAYDTMALQIFRNSMHGIIVEEALTNNLLFFIKSMSNNALSFERSVRHTVSGLKRQVKTRVQLVGYNNDGFVEMVIIHVR